jgi:hypothetical protein
MSEKQGAGRPKGSYKGCGHDPSRRRIRSDARVKGGQTSYCLDCQLETLIRRYQGGMV